HPRSTLFPYTTLFRSQVQIPPRRLFQRGAVSLQWQAEDRNGDQLEYSVYYRSVGENTFHLLKEGLRENFYSTDGAALGDGRYVLDRKSTRLNSSHSQI